MMQRQWLAPRGLARSPSLLSASSVLPPSIEVACWCSSLSLPRRPLRCLVEWKTCLRVQGCPSLRQESLRTVGRASPHCCPAPCAAQNDVWEGRGPLGANANLLWPGQTLLHKIHRRGTCLTWRFPGGGRGHGSKGESKGEGHRGPCPGVSALLTVGPQLPPKHGRSHAHARAHAHCIHTCTHACPSG